jgi:hypothetical protein
MRPDIIISHEFVEFIPEILNENILYVSIPFATAAHKCFCGCGKEVVTPLTPTDWCLIFDGDTVTLDPSIGNWEFECRSHYWIIRDKVKWADQMTKEEIQRGRDFDRRAKDRYFEGKDDNPSEATLRDTQQHIWKRFKKLW